MLVPPALTLPHLLPFLAGVQPQLVTLVLHNIVYFGLAYLVPCAVPAFHLVYCSEQLLFLLLLLADNRSEPFALLLELSHSGVDNLHLSINLGLFSFFLSLLLFLEGLVFDKEGVYFLQGLGVIYL